MGGRLMLTIELSIVAINTPMATMASTAHLLDCRTDTACAPANVSSPLASCVPSGAPCSPVRLSGIVLDRAIVRLTLATLGEPRPAALLVHASPRIALSTHRAP